MAREVSRLLQPISWLAPYREGLSFTLVVAVITYLTLVVGELVPKRIALANPAVGFSFVTEEHEFTAMSPRFAESISGADWGVEAPVRWGQIGQVGRIKAVPTAPGAYQELYRQLPIAMRGDGPAPVDPADAAAAPAAAAATAGSENGQSSRRRQ